tara:strand:- start:77 stop:745 length:669 start_codon:yes stop_codon:yes gene_type:complete
LELIYRKSKEKLTPYAPSWDFAIGKNKIDLDYEKLAKTALEKEPEIKKLPVQYYDDGDGKKLFDGYTGLGKNSTTSRSGLYNVLEWNTPETNALLDGVRDNVETYNMFNGNPTNNLYVRCWVNIMRYGQKIGQHLHNVEPTSYLSAHFTVQCEDTYTCYVNPVNQYNDPDIIKEENIPGTFTIFPSYLPHYTTKHLSFKPRITIAMDIVTKNWDIDPGLSLY